MTKEQDKARLAALKRELAGYEQSGNKDRADQVRKEIRKLDDSGDDKPRGRTAAKKSTAAAKDAD